jgi:hypothetical protein
MRSVVYFPELRIGETVVPAHIAAGVEAPRLHSSVTTATDSALNGSSARLESAPKPRPSRRPSIVHASVIEV